MKKNHIVNHTFHDFNSSGISVVIGDDRKGNKKHAA
jgi:hypothetical protein